LFFRAIEISRRQKGRRCVRFHSPLLSTTAQITEYGIQKSTLYGLKGEYGRSRELRKRISREEPHISTIRVRKRVARTWHRPAVDGTRLPQGGVDLPKLHHA
jgi:hypothetical protein